MPAVSSPPASHLPSKKKKPTPLAVVQAVAQAAQAATAAATAVAQTSPSYVAPGSTTSSSSSSTSSTPTKAPPSLAKEFIKDSKKPKTVSGKYAKASEKAQAKKAKESAKVKRKTAEVTAKYTTSKAKQIPFPKKGPSGAYEGIAAVNQVLRQVDRKGKSKWSPRAPQKPSTGVSAPKPRKVATRLQRAVKQAKPTFGGLDSEQSKVLRTVLNQGVKAGADRKTLLSAVETGLVESGLRNLDYGDADSQGWRQERSMYYKNPTNVKASAKRYFSEALDAKAPGMTAGNIAQAAQQSAFPERYDQMAGQAKPLLKEFTSTRKQAVPKGLKQTAKQTLGKKPTQAILQGGKVVKAKDGKTKKLQVEELFYDPGISMDSGTKISPIGGHSDHVHVSSTNPRSMLQAIAIAHRLGLNVSENPAVDTVDPVHTSGSFHYNSEKIPKALKDLEKRAGASGKVVGQAIDVSGDTDAMAKFDQIIASRATGDAAPVTVGIDGTNLAVKLPTPTTSGTTTGGTTYTGGTSSTGAPMTPAQIEAELKRKGVRSPSLRKRLAKIDHWLTTPLTAETPEISQELIDRILGK